METSSPSYSCDACYSRKIACSREIPRCSRCAQADVNCVYSRKGKIRRSVRHSRSANTQHDHDISHSPNVNINHRKQSTSSDAVLLASAPTPALSAATTTQERLEQFSGNSTHHATFAKLASLLEEYRAAHRSSDAFDVLADDPIKECLRFDDNAAVSVWIDAFISVLAREHYMLLPVPDQILQALRASEPYHVKERAWLIMFYTIALEHVSYEEPRDELKRTKLRKNLWWAFNDIRLFLKPSIIGVHALLLMMRHAEDYMTPSVCWSLVAKACNMLQTVESDQWAEPNPSTDPRTVVFWRLNLLDKSLALALNRVPTIAGNIASQKSLPSLQQFMAPTDARIPRLFEAHFGRQMAQLSLLMGEVWECAHGQRSDGRRVRESLDAWHKQALQVLEAAALVERPLLTDSGNGVPTPFEIGLNTVHCQYNFVAVFLTVPFKDQQYPDKPSEGTITSRRMLDFLPSLTNLASHLKGPFAPDLCQLLQCPIISFGTLWAQSMSMLRSDINLSRSALEAMAKAPPFFAQFSSRNILAVRMKNTTEQMIEHSRLLLSPQVPESASQLNQRTQLDQQSQEMPQRISTRSTRQGADSNVIWTDETINNTEPEPFWSADLDDWLAELNDNFFDSTRGMSQWK